MEGMYKIFSLSNEIEPNIKEWAGGSSFTCKSVSQHNMTIVEKKKISPRFAEGKHVCCCRAARLGYSKRVNVKKDLAEVMIG